MAVETSTSDVQAIPQGNMAPSAIGTSGFVLSAEYEGERQSTPTPGRGDVGFHPEAVGGEAGEMDALRAKDENPDVDGTASGAMTRSGSEKTARHRGSSSSSDEEDSIDTPNEKSATALGDKAKHTSGAATPAIATTPPPKGFLAKFKASRAAKKQAAAAEKAKPTVKPVSLLALFRYSTRTEKIIDMVGIVFAVAAGATQPLMTLIFGNLTTSLTNYAIVVENAAENPGDASLVALYAEAKASLKHEAGQDSLYLVYIGIAMFAATYLYMIIWQYTSEMTSKRIRERYLAATLRQDIAYFDDLGPGEVATRIQTDTHLVSTAISEKVPLSAQYISTFVTGFVLAYIKQAKLAGVLTIMLPAIIITGKFMGGAMGKYSQTGLKHVAEGGSLAEEVIYSIRTAHAFGIQKVLGALYQGHVDKSVESGIKIALVQSLGMAGIWSFIFGGYALAFAWGGTLIARGEATSGSIITCFMSILIVSPVALAFLGSRSALTLGRALALAPTLPPLTMASTSELNPPPQTAIGKGKGAAAKLYETIERVPPIDSASSEGLKLESVTGDITFTDVKFHYPSRPDVPILSGFSGTFRQGQTVALVGASGSGKSTIVSLVERFYDPISGVITLDGHDLRSLNVKWLRQQIKLVQQEPVLFAMSVKENIATGLLGSRYEHAPAEEKEALIIEAAKTANAHDFILKLPNGYDTGCGAGGSLLSGGQKQRVAIARAIASRPLIICFDEATAALDSESERIVQAALDKASEGRLSITIAHRLSTIKDCDLIMVMGPTDQGGAVLEQGNHAELIAQQGAYANLVQAQKLAESQKQVADNADPTGDAAVDAALKLKRTQSGASSITEPNGLSRKDTGRSQASQILAQRAAEEGHSKDKVHGIAYLAKRCYRLNREYKLQYVAGFIASCFAGMLMPAVAIVYGYAISDFTIQDPARLQHQADRNALWYFIIAILCFVIMFTQQHSLITTAETLTGKLRTLSFRSILRQDVAFFDDAKNSTGSLTGNLSDQPQKVNGLAGITLGAIIQACATVVSGCIIGLVFDWKLALVGIACIPLLISAGYVRLKVVVLKDENNKQAHSDASNTASEAAGAIKTVASLTMEQDRLDTYSEALRLPLERSNRAAVTSNLLYAVTQALSFFVISLVFYLGATWLADGTLKLNSFFTVLQSVVFASIQVGNIFTFVPDASKAKSASSAMIKIADSIPEIDAESTEGIVIDPTKFQGNLTFEDVHFRYPTRPHVRVLRSLNLEIPAGKFVALVGPSGCGKSTTIGLLERFYDPLVGKVTLDGIPIDQYQVASYRSQIALVGQEPTLYAGSIRFNVLLGANKPADQVTEAELIQACKDANIYDFIMTLPDGLETFVGMRGSTQLSGGQKQRVAIARALIRNPKILLLDEATSALDAPSEKLITKVLNAAARGRTTIAIAHRLSSIQHADIIYYFKDGRVAEAGTHQELIDMKGGYFELTQLQSLSQM